MSNITDSAFVLWHPNANSCKMYMSQQEAVVAMCTSEFHETYESKHGDKIEIYFVAFSNAGRNLGRTIFLEKWASLDEAKRASYYGCWWYKKKKKAAESCRENQNWEDEDAEENTLILKTGKDSNGRPRTDLHEWFAGKWTATRVRLPVHPVLRYEYRESCSECGCSQREWLKPMPRRGQGSLKPLETDGDEGFT